MWQRARFDSAQAAGLLESPVNDQIERFQIRIPLDGLEVVIIHSWSYKQRRYPKTYLRSARLRKDRNLHSLFRIPNINYTAVCLTSVVSTTVVRHHTGSQLFLAAYITRISNLRRPTDTSEDAQSHLYKAELSCNCALLGDTTVIYR